MRSMTTPKKGNNPQRHEVIHSFIHIIPIFVDNLCILCLFIHKILFIKKTHSNECVFLFTV